MQIRLRELREAKHLTQLGLCQLTNIPQSTISKLERGSQIPSADLIQILSLFFDVTTDYFLGISDCRHPTDHAITVNHNMKHYYNVLLDYAKLPEHYQEIIYADIQSYLQSDSE